MKAPYTLALTWPPSVNRLWRRGKRGMYRSPEYMAWIKESGWSIKTQIGNPEPITGPFKAEITFYPPDRRHRDIDNLVKAILDVVQSLGLIENDRFCKQLVVSMGETDAIGSAFINLSPMAQS